MTDTPLLPCPFCGNKPNIYGVESSLVADCAFIKCKRCAIETCSFYGSKRATPKEEAIKFWNTRAK